MKALGKSTVIQLGRGWCNKWSQNFGIAKKKTAQELKITKKTTTITETSDNNFRDLESLHIVNIRHVSYLTNKSSLLQFWNVQRNYDWFCEGCWKYKDVSTVDSGWVWLRKLMFLSLLGILSFLGFLREPQTFIHLLTDLIWFSALFIALSSFLRVQVWQHRQLLNRLLTDFFSSPASLSPEFKFNFLIEPQSLLTGFSLFFVAPSSFLWVKVAFTDMFHHLCFLNCLLKL